MMFLLMIVFAGNVAFADDEIIICGQNVQNFFYSTDRTRTQNNYVPISNYNTEAGRHITNRQKAPLSVFIRQNLII